MVPSGSSIRSEKGANGEKLLRCEVGESAVKSSPWAAALRAAAKSKSQNLVQIGCHCFPCVPSASWRLLALNTSRNSLEKCFCRCEQQLHTPGRHHHTRRFRRGVAAPGFFLYGDRSGGLGPRAPLRFLFLFSPSLPLPLTPPGRALTERSINSAPPWLGTQRSASDHV